MSEFGVFLGMDWFSANSAMIEYDHHRVTLFREEGVVVWYVGDRNFPHPFAGSVRDTLSCIMENLSITETVELHPELLQVVCDFPNVSG